MGFDDNPMDSEPVDKDEYERWESVQRLQIGIQKVQWELKAFREMQLREPSNMLVRERIETYRDVLRLFGVPEI